MEVPESESEGDDFVFRESRHAKRRNRRSLSLSKRSGNVESSCRTKEKEGGEYGELRRAFEVEEDSGRPLSTSDAAEDILENESDLPNFSLFEDNFDFGSGGSEEEEEKREGVDPARDLAQGGGGGGSGGRVEQEKLISQDDEENLEIDETDEEKARDDETPFVMSDDDDSLLVQPFNETRKVSSQGQGRRFSRILHRVEEERSPAGQHQGDYAQASPLRKSLVERKGGEAEPTKAFMDSEEDNLCFGHQRKSPQPLSLAEVEEEDEIVIDSDESDDEYRMGGARHEWPKGEHGRPVLIEDDECEEAGPRGALPPPRSLASPSFSPTKRVMGTPLAGARSLSSRSRAPPKNFSPIPMVGCARGDAPGGRSDLQENADQSDLGWLDRLPNFKPISVLTRSYTSSADPVYIQYSQQFAYKARGGGTSGADEEEPFIQQTSSRGRKKGKGKANDEDFNSHWITQEGGKKAFVTASQVLTGAKAYKAYEKAKGKERKATASKFPKKRGKRQART
ncbi:hypothetical protein A3770_15p73750 [Chloropicon primus]|uniref:Uncharacterized protein n=1 Tax=Chloropicon primus TaxID=1764295 RepID=A0A5B8MWL9_9CHLO|nr:hypothetical protein A3770_15p73750 [Chloropicon primus]|eukprot:QDZ24857.1 hypothetical protein A3770_15p73750 [Chloropicon primus]